MTRNGLEADKIMNSSVAFTRVQRTELSTGQHTLQYNAEGECCTVIFRYMYSVNNLMPERPFVSHVADLLVPHHTTPVIIIENLPAF